MAKKMNDKNIELIRYDSRAAQMKESEKFPSIANFLLYIQTPYISYTKLFKNFEECKVLEIGAGMGENTEFLLERGFNVCATDISPKSVEVLKKYFNNYANFEAKVADMEKLPFDEESFDVVCSAGSLSYGDNKIVMNEIYRVIRKGGAVIVVDSLNNNPIYKFNRYVHYLRGNRSRSTLIRMPTISLIEKYTKKFGYAEVRYFSSITWLFPILSKILSEKKVCTFSNYIDKVFNIKKSAFKFTMIAIKK